ncbi:Methyltransferase domain-containing protein [Geodermatophilus pulveris]|uniref:Methyltransferase domain-containing protein n=1 Tax=Geodermatophilus pulveris TaxID=1564159 RepID=A0A239J7X0_9ACTN|nr:methyltransferase domain-containing protein [Geodermatophilus pulveris]SNT01598.1 Methyltransferase domain-containing protein [Geodermatophilus pulveris]
MEQSVVHSPGRAADPSPQPRDPAVAGDLRAYLLGGSADGPPEGGRRLARRLRGLLGPGTRHGLKMLGTRLAAPGSARRLRQLHDSGAPLLLNLGSGTYNVPGWVNIDLWGWHAAWGVHPDVVWDLRRPLPLPDGAVDAVFMEHVLEHLPAREGLGALEQCHRLLRPGGVLRLSVPDFGRYARSYVAAATGTGEDVAFLTQERPGRPTPLMAVSEVVYHHGHVSVWDAETLAALMRCAGFEHVTRRAYRDTDLSPVPDSPERLGESLYMEGIRAGSPDASS